MTLMMLGPSTEHACKVGIREIIHELSDKIFPHLPSICDIRLPEAVGQQKWLILSSCWKFGTSELHICFCELQPCLRRYAVLSLHQLGTFVPLSLRCTVLPTVV